VGKRAAWLLGGAIVLALAATFFAPYFPAALGGPASYALVEGDGMEPKLAAGDLAVFRTSDSYEVGDVVAYEAEQGQAIARVVARRKAGYVVAQDVGDGPLRVSTEQITGSLEAALPRAGAALSWLREPLHMLAVPAAAALLGVAVLVGGFRPRLAGGRNPGATGRLPRRWRRFVVPVSGRLDVGDDVVDVTSLAGLVALARQSGRIVLEVAEIGGRTWLVNGDDAVYRFRSAGPAVAAAGPATASRSEPLAATFDYRDGYADRPVSVAASVAARP
jgi:Peptidase S24-like